MIASLTGTVESVDADSAIIDVHGIGFLVRMPSSDLTKIHAGQEAHVLTSMTVSQDAISLYGFLSKSSLDLFHQLLKVSGIGPKVALGVLSAFTPTDFARIVRDHDTTALTKAQGLGKKGAQKIILELANKLVLDEDDASATSGSAAEQNADPVVAQLVDAMVGMGKDASQARAAIEKAIETLGLSTPLPADRDTESAVLTLAFRSTDRRG
ncbi:MAG: Holliday junction branch migration protein RuvA [Pseudoscardovia radai]|nr:Holliday junction branch migration protein RuvA [Pseudoscardovia radai]